MKKIISIVMIIIVFFFNMSNVFAVKEKDINLANIDYEQIDGLVNEIMNKSKIPGLSISLVNEKQTKYLSYGYIDLKGEEKTTQYTLYELGSMSKAFTALGILLLEKQGKISINDKISKYIPWLRVYYKGKHDGIKVNGEVELTIANLLYHTSGIPVQTIGTIPPGTSDDMLEQTVRTIVGMSLDFYPGDRYQYATINYDVLGYIIQIVSGNSYEMFIKKNILNPLGLKHTYLHRNKAEKLGVLSKGYKITFFKPQYYDAPIYRGNTPAGYIISNAYDMERWMKIQMGLVDIPKEYKKLINKSQVGDTTVASHNEYYYAAGWNINIKEKDIRHSGNNPNYSSVIVMRPDKKIGICILSNMNSNATEYLADNILNMIEGKEVTTYTSDFYKSLDSFFSVLTIISVLITILYILLLIKSIIELVKKKRTRIKLKDVKVAGIILAIFIIAFGGGCIYYLPNILFQRQPWGAVTVWGSKAIPIGCFTSYFAFIIFMLFVLLTFNFSKEKEKGYMSLVPLSLLNGVSSALIIFTINESFNRDMEYSNELLVYFIFSVVFFVYTIRLLQGRLIVISNELAYEKRKNMIDIIMNSSFQSIEMIGRDRIFTGLNNDCEALAQIPSIVVGFFSNLLTLVFCLSYLFSKNFWAFIASLGVLLLNGLISLVTSRNASKYWEKNRDVQDKFFEQMQALVNGFKEIVLNKKRRLEFGREIKNYSKLFTELNKVVSIKFLNFSLYNSLMYNTIFGIIVFLFPLIISDLNINQVRENMFIVFYMIGPLGAVVGFFPQLTHLNVNAKRINRLIEDLDDNSNNRDKLRKEVEIVYPKHISIKFNNVVYKYVITNEEAEKSESEFTLGPITTEFRSGEIVFITGGNGSGKSTLGKLITGLYRPTDGEVLVNGKTVELTFLNELFSSVYSDFNLFKKLYGIDYNQKKRVMQDYLELMKISNKVEVNQDGEFKSINLSTGQRKRLAFVISYLEDKPMIIFDEWAAEQDPEFRACFYKILLPMLKEQGKGVIVITHDDRYFNCADKLLKLERGILL